MIKQKIVIPFIKVSIGLYCLVAVLIGCTPSTALPGGTLDAASVSPGPGESVATIVPRTPTAAATLISSLPHPTTSPPTVTPSPSPTITATPTVMDTPTTPAATATPYPIRGDLFIFRSPSPYDPSYIHRYSLDSGEGGYVLQQEEGWQRLKAWFSPRGTLAAYWVDTGHSSELWLTPLDPWSPELVLSLPETGYDLETLDWLVDDRYLLLQLYTDWPDKADRSYLINTESKQVESVAGWRGDCSILAFSSQTNHLATWCPMGSEQDPSSTYAVLEESGDLWFSEQPPEENLTETLSIFEPWLWSLDGRYVVFNQMGTTRFQLGVINTNTGETKVLTDENSSSYAPYALSPDNRYLYYGGKCDDGLFCELVMDTETEEVIWTNQAINSPGGGWPLFWSPDSHYFAISLRNGAMGIVEVATGEMVLQLDGLSGQMVWVQDRQEL